MIQTEPAARISRTETHAMMPGFLRIDEYPTHRIGELAYCIGHTSLEAGLRSYGLSSDVGRVNLFLNGFHQPVCSAS